MMRALRLFASGAVTATVAVVLLGFVYVHLLERRIP